ncbi:hypothetical protein HF1_08510 [Mycoplasma haemofelis str. Langford 1]|uniref:Uncharacterized protein n=2 Tax=Mycoplasma haemofelis TaxID=29501 RepID=F6FIZ0_MYCHI|nr:hypothetical protein [Mycoplasma haemofelis]AEG73188.1 hypothetical protein MHF_0931 [Mycoplasma haemofelis Ohio2]CBY92859.1 hypothetical protein HF1_08510 [Mycoplasma haemofelis str. Langford 1]
MSKTIALGSLAGVGGTGVLGYGAYTMMQPSNVKEVLIKNNFKLTSDLSGTALSDAWTKVLETYKVEATSDTKIREEEITSKDIEEWCLSSLKVKVNDKHYESTYSKASKWCVIYTTISEKLKSENKAISTNDTNLKSKYDSMPEHLKTSILNGADSNKAGEKTKEWCGQNSKRSFLGSHDTHYQNLISYCLAV